MPPYRLIIKSVKLISLHGKMMQIIIFEITGDRILSCTKIITKSDYIEFLHMDAGYASMPRDMPPI